MTDFVDPRQLTQGQRTALRLAATADLYRRPHGWNAGSGRRVPLATGKALIGLGLAREDFSRRHPRLVATGHGLQLQAVIEERQRQRKRT